MAAAEVLQVWSRDLDWAGSRESLGLAEAGGA